MEKVYGQLVDRETRCIHYHSQTDIIAIKFKCCNKYYPCYMCHQECEQHPITPWPKQDFDIQAILCGVCRYEHTINEYMQTSKCVNCNSLFNEGCQTHYHLYFEVN
ncbi:CHY zinc finger protein [Ornithinibacillus salinisoli]|uniref:CHY zinc finger protein n=1 Tax=Ornithinibacillus salinisoli TaxID=1848459 RepID=A0ABW4VZL2_9BACI